MGEKYRISASVNIMRMMARLALAGHRPHHYIVYCAYELFCVISSSSVLLHLIASEILNYGERQCIYREASEVVPVWICQWSYEALRIRSESEQRKE